MLDTSELVLNLGSQHPSTHGVLRVVLRLDGERVIDADIVIGYLHRGIEKLCEQRDYQQIVLITDRIDYVAAASNNLGYCETVEKLMSLEVPPRARYIRTVLAELQRIASHCLWLGTHAMDLGAMAVFLHAFRERELILDLFEEYCGARLTYNAMRIGGLPLDIPAGWDAKVSAFCSIMDTRIPEYEELLTQNRIWLGSDARDRYPPGTGRDCPWPERSGAARLRRRERHQKRRALRGLRGLRVRHSCRRGGRHVRSVPGAHGGAPTVPADRSPGARRLAGGTNRR